MLFNEENERYAMAMASRLEEYCRLEGLNAMFLRSEAKENRLKKRKSGITVRQIWGSLIERVFH